jgi:hypothetical protein
VGDAGVVVSELHQVSHRVCVRHGVNFQINLGKFIKLQQVNFTIN